MIRRTHSARMSVTFRGMLSISSKPFFLLYHVLVIGIQQVSTGFEPRLPSLSRPHTSPTPADSQIPRATRTKTPACSEKVNMRDDTATRVVPSQFIPRTILFEKSSSRQSAIFQAPGNGGHSFLRAINGPLERKRGSQ